MIKLFTSYRFAFLLIALLFVTLIVETFASHSMSALQSGLSYWYTALLGMLTVSILVCTFQRVIRELRRRRNEEAVSMINHHSYNYVTTLSPAKVEKTIKGILHQHGWNPKNLYYNHSVLLEKGSIGIWGSILFHVALIVCIVGIALNVGVGFRGMFALTEGETFHTGTDSFKNVSAGRLFRNQDQQGFAISLEKFERKYLVGKTTTPASHMLLKSNRTTVEDIVRVNNGLSYAGYQLHQGELWGYSLGLIIADSLGKNLVRGFVRIASQRDSGLVQFKDRLILENDREVRIEFFPNFILRNGRSASINNEANNPVAVVSLFQKGKLITEHSLRLGDESKMGGYLITFPQVRYWSQFEYVYDPGLWLLYVGFGLGVFGLALRFFFVRKRLGISVLELEQGTTVIISGSAEKFHKTFELELVELSHHLRSVLRKEEDSMLEQIHLIDKPLEEELCN